VPQSGVASLPPLVEDPILPGRRERAGDVRGYVEGASSARLSGKLGT
jgi:hypothetical protein